MISHDVPVCSSAVVCMFSLEHLSGFSEKVNGIVTYLKYIYIYIYKTLYNLLSMFCGHGKGLT